ncbi:hypothetical protein [Mycolicibacterium helvum]|uniref:Uncharacterized protein n=1 Tax=Mycolicibacterium helvum TaxID=1534349 RepID=A0A7I7SZA7_9MYCO|nr:hypothetical protein [Mycolicibacterium helvum]BBY62352.1 hypothetical protein MHEL_05950 [Mycolicibacterium helvum]
MGYLYRTLVTGAATAALAVGAAVTAMATAVADDLPPADPGAPPPPAQQGFVPPAATISDSVNGFANLFGGPAGNQMLLGQTPAPAVAAAGTAPATPPNVDVLDGTQLLLPRNYRTMQGADDPTPSPYDLQQGVPPGPFARVDGLKGVHAMIHGALGRMPAEQLGQPLPGTAPLPGINIPAGPEQFLPDPATPPPPGAPADPALPPPAPPAPAG